MSVPTNLIPTKITGLPEYTGTSQAGYFPYVLEGTTYKVQFSNVASAGEVPPSRTLTAGTGLVGGGDLSANRVFAIANGGVGASQLDTTGVVAGVYGNGSNVPTVTVDANGRVTSVTTSPVVATGYVPEGRTVTAGTGLLGGGSLANNITLSLNLATATPQALGTATAGVSTAAAREDHVHPAVDLSDTNETQGSLPLGRGGTGDALSPVAGAVVYSTGTKLALTNPGIPGQVLTSNGTDEPLWTTIVGTGTVTSVNASGGTTGMTFTGGPVTTIGTLTLGGTLGTANGGTGVTGTPTNGQLLIGNGSGYTLAALTAGTGVSVGNAAGAITITNTAPDQIVSLTGVGTTSISGTYPNFTITSNDQFVGTVTSVAASGGTTGLTFSGSPITSAGTITLGGTLAIGSGGTGASTAGAARTALGAAALGANTDITSIALTSGTIQNAPTSGTDIVNKAYADSIASGINFHQSVRLATVAALPAYTYNNGTGGVGATITANANGALSIDGVAVVAGNRVLIKNEVGAAQANHGVYVVTQTGNGSTPFILTRATDFDSAGTGVDQIDAGDFFLVTAGSTLSNTSWVQQTPLPITVGTTPIIFSQFGAPVLYTAGTGLTLAGTVFSITNTGVTASTYGSASQVPVIAVNAQGQITSASSTSIAIAASQITSGALAVARGGTGATTLTSNGVLLGNGTSAIGATAVGTTGQVLVGNTGAAPTWATLSSTAVTSFSAGTTGLTPSSPTTGAVTLGGTLAVANGGTGVTTSTGSVSVVLSKSPTLETPILGAATATSIANGLGAVGTPSYTFVGDSNTGMWSPGADTIAFSEGGVEIMRINSAGNLGIGTSAPAQTLQVVNAGNYQFRLGAGSTFNYDLGRSGSDGLLYFYGNQSTFTGYVFGGVDGERMRITSAGNVGIGTSSPSERLDVIGNARIGGGGGTFQGIILTNSDNSASAETVSFIDARNNLGTADGDMFFGHQTDGGSYIRWATTPPGARNTDRRAERMRINPTGNVGIGTSAPASLLHVKRGSNAIEVYPAGTWASRVINATDAAGENGLLVGNRWAATNSTVFEAGSIFGGGTGSWYSYYRIDGAGQSIWSNIGVERMRLDASGNVGIGTSSPGARLHLENAGSTVAVRLGITASNQYLDIFRDASTGFSVYNAAQADPFRSHVWQLGGSEAMRINSAGNVGIGTSAPSSRLSVAYSSTSFADGLAVTNSATGTGAWSRISVQAGINYAYTGITNTGELYLFNTANAATVFGTNNAERMRIDSSGNVGIGTSAPAQTLQVVNAGNYQFRLGAGSTFNYDLGRSGSDGLLYFYGNQSTFTGYVFGGVDGERMRINASGNVGIGTSAPGARLQINVQDGFRFDVEAGAASTMRFGSALTGESTGALAWVRSAGAMTFSSGASGSALTERMRIDASGNLLVGSSASPSGSGTNLQVSSSVAARLWLTATGNRNFYFESSSGNALQIVDATAGAERMRIDSSGEVYIAGTADQGAFNLQVNGTGVWGAGAYVNGSDRSLKEDIAPLAEALDVINALKPVTFRYKEDYSKDQSIQPGFIAQELQEALGGEVYVDGVVQAGPKHLNVAYQSLIPVLVKAIQELTARVAQLEGN